MEPRFSKVIGVEGIGEVIRGNIENTKGVIWSDHHTVISPLIKTVSTVRGMIRFVKGLGEKARWRPDIFDGGRVHQRL